MSFFENTRKPQGFGGKLMTKMMNSGHSRLSQWGFSNISVNPDAEVLDVGCGGGANIAVWLSKCRNGHVTGLDYSEVSVLESRKLNAAAIQQEKCKVIQGDVSAIPFPDEILFGYNIDDSISASKVLSDGYGQCNTKGTLFMALLRACKIPCRVHGFTIDKQLQKGAMTGIVYKNAPQNVFHSWVEVYLDDTWYELEAFILDKKYLNKLQKINSQCSGAFCGYGVAVKDFQNPVIDFERNNTYIQSEGINQDFGIYNSPDELLTEHHQEMSIVKAFAYRHFGRHLMNKNVKRIRDAKV